MTAVRQNRPKINRLRIVRYGVLAEIHDSNVDGGFGVTSGCTAYPAVTSGVPLTNDIG